MRRRLAHKVLDWIFPLGFVGMLATPVIWAYQIVHWLEFGTWRAVTVANGLHWAGISQPHSRLASVQKINHLVMSFPLSITIFFVILAVLVAAGEWSNAAASTYDERASEAVRKSTN